jgi:hypothetical protein
MANGIREKCANIGCNNLQVPSLGKIGEPGTRYRAVCSNCHKHSYNGWKLPDGITDFKNYQCSNQNGHLGFECATDHSKISDSRGKFHIDHIDGDCTNNALGNLQELCLNCHQEKGMRAGDYAKTTNVTNNSKSARISPGKASASAMDAFHKNFYYEVSDNDEELEHEKLKRVA